MHWRKLFERVLHNLNAKSGPHLFEVEEDLQTVEEERQLQKTSCSPLITHLPVALRAGGIVHLIPGLNLSARTLTKFR